MPCLNSFALSLVACRASIPTQEGAMLPDIFLPSTERFRFEVALPAGLQMAIVIVAFTLNFAIMVGVGVIAWRFLRA